MSSENSLLGRDSCLPVAFFMSHVNCLFLSASSRGLFIFLEYLPLWALPFFSWDIYRCGLSRVCIVIKMPSRRGIQMIAICILYPTLRMGSRVHVAGLWAVKWQAKCYACFSILELVFVELVYLKAMSNGLRRINYWGARACNGFFVDWSGGLTVDWCLSS